MKAKIDRGVAPECFGRQFVEAGYSKKGIDELQAAFVAGSTSLSQVYPSRPHVVVQPHTCYEF